jgi:hypothetical protein
MATKTLASNLLTALRRGNHTNKHQSRLFCNRDCPQVGLHPYAAVGISQIPPARQVSMGTGVIAKRLAYSWQVGPAGVCLTTLRFSNLLPIAPDHLTTCSVEQLDSKAAMSTDDIKNPNDLKSSRRRTMQQHCQFPKESKTIDVSEA